MVNIQQLEPFKEVLRRQVPREVGKPIPMKVYEIKHPKNSGDPWMGAYSKHGFWYKFYRGNSDDFDKIVAHSYETDGYCMNYESFSMWKSAFGDLFEFIVAKNLKGDVLGSVAFACYDDVAVIGVYFVIEDYRHSGIGTKLFSEALKRIGSKNIIFHSLSHLSCKNSRFGFHSIEWTFSHYVVDKPVGLQSLQNSEIKLKKIDALKTNEESDLFNYDKKICGIDRSQWNRLWLQHADSDTIIAFDNQDRITGFGNARELAGGFVKRLLVGPLYADNEKVVAAILFALLVKYYNPENDHEWDPDVFAIYRREVHFIIPEGKTRMLEIMHKLKGNTGTISKQRLSYKSFINALNELKNWPKHQDNRFSMDIKMRPLLFSCHDVEQVFLYEICDASDLFYLRTRYNYEIFRCDEMSRKASIRSRFVRCVKQFLSPCEANHEGKSIFEKIVQKPIFFDRHTQIPPISNYDPYGVFMKKVLKNTTTIKKVLDLSQAHSHYPLRLFEYAAKKVVADRRKECFATDPWDSFFYGAYRPKKPSRYNTSASICIECVTDCPPENEGNLVVQRQQSLPTETVQKYSTPKKVEMEMIAEETTSDNDKHQRSLHGSQTFSEDSRGRVLLEVDPTGMRLVHHRLSVAQRCAECELARQQIYRGERRARSEFPRRDLARIPYTVDGNITLPRHFYLPMIPKSSYPPSALVDIDTVLMGIN